MANSVDGAKKGLFSRNQTAWMGEDAIYDFILPLLKSPASVAGAATLA